jgi:hypothetical protein
VEYGGDADPGAQVLGIGCDGERGLGRRFEQEIVRSPLPGRYKTMTLATDESFRL